MIKFNNQETDSAVGIYAEATRLSPISKTKKNKVLSDYGIKAGWSKGKSDSAISRKAANAALAKFKKDQAKAKKTTDASKPPIKTGDKIERPAVAKTLARSDAATIARKYGVDPAKLFGYGTKGFSSWLTSSAAAYVWKDAASFEAWLKRAIRSGSIPR